MDVSVGGTWAGRIDEQDTPLSKQQLVQLIRSLILVEQVFVLVI